MNGVDQQIDELASSDEDRREPPGSISVCKWSDCVDTFDEQSKLIRHIHDDHIPPGKDAYACEWLQCTRNGQKQASRHALITHCRAHTGERPYICSHPGCAKTFTRSDALSKHVRSVHATKPPPPSPVDWREAIEAGLYQDVDLAEALTRIEKDDPFWLVTDSDLHIATQIREKYPHDTSDPAKTYIPTSPIHPDELPRPLWQVRYIMAKAKLMLLEEENRMRRTQLLELMESC